MFKIFNLIFMTFTAINLAHGQSNPIEDQTDVIQAAQKYGLHCSNPHGQRISMKFGVYPFFENEAGVLVANMWFNQDSGQDSGYFESDSDPKSDLDFASKCTLNKNIIECHWLDKNSFITDLNGYTAVKIKDDDGDIEYDGYKGEGSYLRYNRLTARNDCEIVVLDKRFR